MAPLQNLPRQRSARGGLASPLLVAAIVLVVGLLGGQARGDEDPGAMANWGQWRGPLGTGVAPLANPPRVWSEQEHVRWKVALPGLGHSTPIVWGDQVFVTTAAPTGEELPPTYGNAPGAHDNLPVSQRDQFMVIAVDRRDGRIQWSKTVHEALPHEGGHYSGSLASASPVTDGESVFAYFGSFGLYCLDLDGRLKWQRQLGVMQSKHGHGEGSSPALYGDTLVVNWDHEGESFLAALDKRSGVEKWRSIRDEVTSWATPIVVRQAGRPQVIVSGTHRIRGYDLNSGEVIWECGGLSANVVASPVAAEGMLFAASSYDTRNLLAINLNGARGDITGSDHVVWSRRERTPYVPSPLLYQGSIYFLRHYQGILTRLEAKTGEERVGPFRLGALRDVYASPVAAAGRVYVTDLDGATQIISDEEIPRSVAVNRLDDRFSASAALVGAEMFLRGRQFLYCLAEE